MIIFIIYTLSLKKKKNILFIIKKKNLNNYKNLHLNGTTINKKIKLCNIQKTKNN